MALSNLFKKKMKDPVRGTARIVAMTRAPQSGTSSTCKFTLVVEAPGVEAVSREHRDWHVLKRKWPSPGDVLPVEVDRADPTRLEILWDEVPDWQDAATQEADALAARLRGDAPNGGVAGLPPEAAGIVEQLQQAFPGATVEVGGAGATAGAGAVPDTAQVDIRNDPELRAKLEQVLGYELTPGTSVTVADNDPALQMRVMQAIQEHRAQAAAGPAPNAGGDRVGQLERLAKLRDQGVLSQAEFDAEKARILGGP